MSESIPYEKLQTMMHDMGVGMGVSRWGTATGPVPSSLDKYEAWVDRQWHGPLGYLDGERRAKRRDLRQHFPEFQSALMCLFPYAPRTGVGENGLKIASYVLGFEGEDYHHVLKERLSSLSDALKKEFPQLTTGLTLDTQPILERDLAYRAGLGWFGKNSMLIHREDGSFFLIGGLLLSLPVEGAPPFLETDHCGTCNACTEACPTNAIDPVTRTLRARDCLSTYTIELFKDAPAPEGIENAQGEIFGCDICQDVCPWNRRALERPLSAPQGEKAQTVREFFLQGDIRDVKEKLQSLTVRGFKKLFRGTPLERTGREGLMKNLKALSKIKRTS